MRDRRQNENVDSAGIVQILKGLVGPSGTFSQGDVTIERGTSSPDKPRSFTITKKLPDCPAGGRFTWKLSVQERFEQPRDGDLSAPVPVVTLEEFEFATLPLADGSFSPHVPRDPIREVGKVLRGLTLPKRG